MKQRILSLIIALAICVTSIPCMAANAQEDVGSNELSIAELAGGEETSEYHIIEGEQLFFEDFEGEELDAAYTPSDKFAIQKDDNGNNALSVNGTGATIATNTFGPELTNYLVEADIKLTNCNAGTNGGLYINTRKTPGKDNAPGYSLLYTPINTFDWENRNFSGSVARDNLIIARSSGSYNIAKWVWTSTSGATSALDSTTKKTFADYVHMKMYVSDEIVRSEMYSTDGEQLAVVEQSTDEIDSISGTDRITAGNIQLGAHSCVVLFDNISIKEISVIKTVSIKTSAEEMTVGENYDIWVESETGEKIPFTMLQWTYDEDKLEIADGKIVVKEAGEFEIKITYGDAEAKTMVKAVAPDTGDDDDEASKYYILKGQQVFFEDFEGENLNSAYTPSASQFELTTDSQGDKALCINAIGAALATDNFGPELTNYLVEADVKLADTNAGRNGGLFISARKSAKNSPAYNMLYTVVNTYDWENKNWNGSAVKDRLLIARSKGSFNIGNGWTWTSMSDEIGILKNKSFEEYVHMKMYMSDAIIRLEIYSADGEKLVSLEQSTDEVDSIFGGTRIEKGNIQLGAHSCRVWYDNISISEISIIESAAVKTSVELLSVGETYDIWAESETGEEIPFNLVQWEYDEEKLEIAAGKITAKAAGEFEVKILYDGGVTTHTVKATAEEYNFTDYEIICERPNVFFGEKIAFSLAGVCADGTEYTVVRNINCQTNAGEYDGTAIVTDTAGESELSVTYNQITKSIPVYVSEYSAAEIRLGKAEIYVETSTELSVWATKNGTEERVNVSDYMLTLDEGLSADGEVVTAETTGEKKLYVQLDKVYIETVLSVEQRREGIVINEDFEDGWYSEFFSVPLEDVATDSDGNKVYKLQDEFSPFYGDVSWHNYRITGKVKILDKRIGDNRYNTSFSIYYRQQIPADEKMTGGQYGLPAVYCMDEDLEYLRIGSQNGADFAAEENVWYDFSLETNGTQQIFALGGKEVCFDVAVDECGGFVLNAENCCIYLDDIKVERFDADDTTFEPVKIEIENDGVEVDVYANRQITSLFAVRAVDADGNYKYISGEAEYEVLSGNAEIVSDSLSLRIDSETTENVKIGIKYDDMYQEAEIVPVKNYDSRTEYLKATQSIRNKNFCYKMLRSASTLGVLDESHLFCLSYVTSLLALQPTRRSYDRELNWFVSVGESQSAWAGVQSNVDFVVNVLLVLRHELKGIVSVSDETWAKVDEFIKNEYYGDSDTLLSENHRIVNFTDAYLIGELFPDDIMYGGKTGRETAEEYAQYILDWMNFRYKYGMTEYDSTYYSIDMVALETLYNYTTNENMRRICNDFLNWLYADSVIDAMGDRLTGAHGRTYFNTDVLAKMYNLAQRFETEEAKWTETNGAYGVQPAVYSFLTAELDDTVYEIANADKIGLVNKETQKTHHLPDDEEVETSNKYTYFGDGYSLGCLVNYENPFHDVTYKGDKYYKENGTWVAGGHQELSMTAVIEGNDKRFITFSQPGPSGPSDVKSKHMYYSGFYNYPAFNYMQHQNTIIGLYYIADEAQLQYTHCYIPTKQFERVDEEDGWIFLLSNNVYTAIKPLKAGELSTEPAYRWGDEVLFTGSNILLSENEILIEDAHSGFIMQMTSFEESGMSFEEFKAIMKQTSIEYSLEANGTLSYTTYNGDILKVVYDTGKDSLNGVIQDYSDWKLFDSEYMQSDYGSGYTTITAGSKEFIITPIGHEHTYDNLNSNTDNHWKECECGDKHEEAAHNWEWVIDRAATAAEQGSKHEECNICGAKRNEGTEISKLVETELAPDDSDCDSSADIIPDGNDDTGSDLLSITVTPSTGDNNNVILWITLSILCMGASTIVFIKKR